MRFHVAFIAMFVAQLSAGANAQQHIAPKPYQRPLWHLVGEGSGSFPGFGYSVAELGDVDDDGVSDLVVGEPYAPLDGKAKVFSGATGAQLGPALTTPQGWTVGFSVSGIGDIDRDGHADVLVGDPMFGGVGPGGTGQAWIFSGRTGAILLQVLGAASSDEFGYSVASAGDVDLDGTPDFAVGATEDHDFSPGPGYARLISGETGGVIRTYTTTGTHKRYGQSLVNLGDVDGDATPDLLVGASAAKLVQARSGATGALLWQQLGPATEGSFGWDVELVGDWNADGAADVAIGAIGRVRILRASDGAFVHDLVGSASAYWGGALAALGDVDGDGYDDLAVGAKWATALGTPFIGAAYVYSGRTQHTLSQYFGALNGDRLGFALASIADLDGDGVRELIVGANQETNSGPGFVDVYPGSR